MEFKVGDFVTGIHSNGEVLCIGIVKEYIEDGRLFTYALLDLKTNEVFQRELTYAQGRVRLSTEDEKRQFLDRLIKLID